jgi:putative hydrolase of the HAD superfamily
VSRAFDAVLCDLDGVIRRYDNSGLARLEREAGLAAGTTARVAFSPEVNRPQILGQITRDEWVEAVATALAALVPDADAGTARALGRALADSPFDVDPEVVTLLGTARAHLPLVMVTNATLALEDDLVLLGIDGLAHSVVSSARVGVAKPDRRIYEIAAERAGVPVERCLFVDDSAENVEAAVALGMTGVHYREAADLRAALGSLS